MLLRFPDKAEIAQGLWQKLFAEEQIDLGCRPAIGGIVIAYEVARALGVPSIFAERENGEMTLRRGFSIEEDQRVLVVEDVITTGGSTQEVADLVAKSRGRVVAAASIIDRSSKDTLKLKVPFKSLLKRDIPVYKEEDCPMCKEGSRPYKPGSRNI
jgi:orotate phosphoribosyltransferase